MSNSYQTTDSIGRQITVEPHTLNETITLRFADGSTVTSTGLHLA